LHDFLHHALDSTWELYPRPFLNGDYPPLAALHPIHGLTIFGVFPWDLRDYRCEQRGRYLRYFQRTESGLRPIHSPVRRVEHQVENLINLYLPHIGESIARDRRSLFAFQVVLYFPHATTYAAQVFAPMAPGRGSVFGYDAVEATDMAKILPATQRPTNRAVQGEWLDDLRCWLAPPPHSPTQTRNFQLTEEQLRHVEPAPMRHQRLHGVAGSGKTLVIAQRAANLAAAGKRVLVVTFNVTLWQYIRTLVSQSAVAFRWENIEFHHFHGFCKNFLTANGIEWPRTTGRAPKQALDELVPHLVMETVERIQQATNPTLTRYDAILIDEGQDFPRLYYDMLCQFLTENDEVLFVADRRQNLYLRDDSWLDKMSGTKFRGRWREMKQSYRLPVTLAREANRFAALFLPDPANPTADAPAASPIEPIDDLANSYLGWHNMENLVTIIELMRRTIHWLIRSRGLKPADIVILTPNQSDGWAVATALEAQGMAVNHILSADDGQVGRRQRRFRKRTFAPEDERLKVSTIHSFKGWELNTVLVLTPVNDHFWEAQSPYLFYVAMTRARQNLIVFNRYPAYRAYGATWNELYDDPTAPKPASPAGGL
jgi:KaiC/GvpD/RAD55 family RecA-like ATPase